MTATKTEIERLTEIASARENLATAKSSVDFARMRLNHTDVGIEEELWEVYDILDKLVIKLREEIYKGVNE